MNPSLRGLSRPFLLLVSLAVLPAATAAPARAAPLPAPIDEVTTPKSPITAAYSESPFLAPGPDGSAWMTWFERRAPDGHRLMIANYRAGRWSVPRQVAAGDSFYVNWAEIPEVLPFSSGRLMVTWPWKVWIDPLSYGIRLGIGTATGPLGPTIRPHDDNSRTPHGFQSLMPEGDGVRIVWLDGRFSVPKPDSAGDTELRTAFITRGGEVKDERVLDHRVCDCCRTAVVPVPGGALAVYRDRTADETRDIMLVRSEHGKWGQPYPLAPDHWRIHGCPVNGPAADAHGERVTVAWFTQGTSGPAMKVAFSSDGGRSFAAPIVVDSASAIGRPQVMMLEDGSALVMWITQRRRLFMAAVSRVTPDGGVSPPVTLGSLPRKAGGYPQMARVGDRLLFAWTDVQPSRPATVSIHQARLLPLH